MANYATLLAAIRAAIKANDQQAITGDVLQTVLTNIVGTLGAGYQFAGIATPTTNPGTPDGKVWYLAPAGSYPNFGATVAAPFVVPAGSIGVFAWSDTWTRQTIEVASVIPDVITYAECTTPAATAAKVVAADNFRLVPGVQFRVKFSQANTAANPTLNIGGTGALPIVYGGEAASATNSWEAGEVVLVYYDGTSWQTSAAQGGGEKTLPDMEITDVQVQGYYNYTNGGFADNNTVVATRKIFVPHGFKVSVGAGYTYSVVMYDLAGNYVSGISWTGSETVRKHQGYIIVNVRNATLDTPTELRVTLTDLIFPDPVLIYDRDASRVRDNAISALMDTLYSGTPVLLAPLPDYLQTFTDLNSGALIQRSGGTVDCSVCGAFRVSVNAGYQFSLGKRAKNGQWLGSLRNSFSQASYEGIHTGFVAINVKNDAGTPLDMAQWSAAGLKIEIADLGILYRIADIESRILPPSDGLYYSGEKLSMAGNRCKLESVNCIYPTSQGGASYNNYLFLSGAVPGVVLYNPDTKSFSRYATMSGVAYPETEYGAAHFNTMCFGRKKSADDDFPLLYVSQWDGNRGCIVYWVDTANSSYVPWQYIDISALSTSIVGQGNTDFIVDPDEQLLYLIRYKLDTPYDAEGNTNVITCFALPNESINGRIALTDADILWSDEYYREFIRQDSHFAAGKIYTGYGSGPNTGGKWVLTVYDTYLRRIVTIIDRSKESTLREIEAVVEIGGNLAVLNTGNNYIQFIY